MRIVLHDYSGHPFQMQLSRKLADRGHDVLHVYSSSVETPRGALELREGDSNRLRIVGLQSSKPIPKGQFVQRLLLEREYAFKLRDLVAEERPDVVICANTPSLVAFEVMKLCVRKKYRFVTWLQDIYGLAAYRILRKKIPGIGHLAGQYLMHLDRKSLRNSSSVVCITEDFVPYVVKAGVPQARIRVIHNWAPLEEIPECPRDNSWSRRNQLGDGIRFLYSGTLAMKHNPNLLLQLAVTMKEWGSAELVVVSQGPGADWLRENASKSGLTNLKIFGFQPFQDLPEVLASADVVTAILEPDAGIFSVPSKVLSYFSAGRPLLAAMPIENLAARTIVNAEAGLVSPPNDLSAWLANAKTLYESAAKRQQMGAAARQYAESKFDIESIATQFEELIGPSVQSESPVMAS